MRSVGALGAAVGLSAHVGALDSAAATRKGLDAGSGEIPRRPLGRTGVQVSAIGVGGHHLGDLSTVDDAVRLVHEAVDAGITSSKTAGSTTTARPRTGSGGHSGAGATRSS